MTGPSTSQVAQPPEAIDFAVPLWMLRLVWTIRGRKLARLHIRDADPSLEGILVGVTAGHYVLLNPKLVEAEDRTHALQGHIEVPVGNVLFVQVLS